MRIKITYVECLALGGYTVNDNAYYMIIFEK